MLNRQAICDALRQLSSIEEQKRLWLSTGANNSDVSSFVEACEQLYTDTGLSDELVSGSTGFPEEVNVLLLKLDSILKRVDDRHGPRHTIDDPTMDAVRGTAGRILELLNREMSADSIEDE